MRAKIINPKNYLRKINESTNEPKDQSDLCSDELVDIIRSSRERGLTASGDPTIKHLVELPMTEAEYKRFVEIVKNQTARILEDVVKSTNSNKIWVLISKASPKPDSDNIDVNLIASYSTYEEATEAAKQMNSTDTFNVEYEVASIHLPSPK